MKGNTRIYIRIYKDKNGVWYLELPMEDTPLKDVKTPNKKGMGVLFDAILNSNTVKDKNLITKHNYEIITLGFDTEDDLDSYEYSLHKNGNIYTIVSELPNNINGVDIELPDVVLFLFGYYPETLYITV